LEVRGGFEQRSTERPRDGALLRPGKFAQEGGQLTPRRESHASLIMSNSTTTISSRHISRP